MQSGSTKTRTRRQSVSSKTTGKQTVTSKKTSKTESRVEKPVPVKRSIKDKGLKDRAVRFRSTDEEYFFEIESSERIVVPDGSDIFQKILKDMKGDLDEGGLDDDEVFDGVFTASAEHMEKRTEIKKPAIPRKSILKRRSSYRR